MFELGSETTRRRWNVWNTKGRRRGAKNGLRKSVGFSAPGLTTFLTARWWLSRSASRSDRFFN
jgi:hypothetical protein